MNLCQFWLKFISPPVFDPMATRGLVAVDWATWKAKAEAFFRAHPGVPVSGLTRGERLLVPGAREAFAVFTSGAQQEVRQLGGQPCQRCGLWTCAWCEGCRVQPFAPICSECDCDHLLCQACADKGSLFLEVQQPSAGDDTFIEVSGYNDGDQFVPIDPPICVPLSEVPVSADGVFDVPALMQRLGRD